MSSSDNSTAAGNATAPAADSTNCGSANNQVDLLGLRVGALFVIMFTSMFGALFPVVSRRFKIISLPPLAFDFAKYFGSGVIIATAFIHLLSPALDALGSSCLTGTWTVYPWALAISMASVFSIFFLELFAFRWGSAKLASIGIKTHDPHGHDIGPDGAHSAHGPEKLADSQSNNESDIEKRGVPADGRAVLDTATAQVLGIAILEFGVVFHSILIGLTLAVDPEFKILFIVLVFHQMFEGLGLGSRLAFMQLPPKYNYVPVVGALIYGITTPVGIAAGLGVRSTYNPNSTTASIVSGTLDSISSGILLYTGLVELLAHEFLFNPTMHQASNGRLAFACITMLFGAGIMSLLGRWA
ncbi:ZIP-like iron-zinc transporter [Gautieria morchelliformis]|nr:ZIP-like iron-zinc transporter [Gautieria morchelliformis]